MDSCTCPGTFWFEKANSTVWRATGVRSCSLGLGRLLTTQHFIYVFPIPQIQLPLTSSEVPPLVVVLMVAPPSSEPALLTGTALINTFFKVFI